MKDRPRGGLFVSNAALAPTPATRPRPALSLSARYGGTFSGYGLGTQATLARLQLARFDSEMVHQNGRLAEPGLRQQS